MTRTRRAIWGVVTNYASTAVTAVAGFILVPIVLRFVSREDYGLWAAVGQAVGYLALLDLGVGSAVIRRTAQFRERGDATRAASVTVSTAVVMYGALGLLFLIAGLLLAPVLPRVLAVGPDRGRTASMLFLLMAIYGGLSLPLRVSLKALYGFQQMARANLIMLSENVLTPLTAVVLLGAGLGLFALPLGSIAAGGTAAIAGIIVLRRAVPGLRVSWRHSSREEARELFSWSWLLWLNSLAVVVIYQTDNLVVAAGGGLAAATVFSLTSRLPLYAMPLIFALADSCMPAAVELCEQGRIDRLRDIYLRVMRVTAGAALAAGIVAVSFNDWFMRLWVGSQNFGGFALTLACACILLYRVLMQAAALVVIGTGKIRGVVFMSALEAAVNLALSVWWVRRYGITGVACATVVAGVITSGWYVTYVVCRELRLSVIEYIWRGIGLPIVNGVPAAIVAWQFLHADLPASWIWLALAAGTVSAVYALTFFFFSLTPLERHDVWRYARGLTFASQTVAHS
jgi:O-antigen/teichoic acid export membrane protein